VKKDLQTMANAVRALSVDMVEAAGSGHPGMPLGAADIMTVLFANVLKHDPGDPLWADRDRFVLSAGHASAMLYATLHLSGYPVTEADMRAFRQLGSLTSGHPEVDQDKGIECTTGPLGQGIGMGVGMAIAELIAGQRAPGFIDHHTWILAGDGCLMEGISHEACSLAGRLGLSKLILLFDDNNNTIDGRAAMASCEDHTARFAAYGWATLEADGHDFDAIEKVLNEAKSQERPTFVKLTTIIGKYSPLADSHKAHGSVLGAQAALETRRAIGMGDEAFEIPAEAREMWLEAAARCTNDHSAWQKKAETAGRDVAAWISGPGTAASLRDDLATVAAEAAATVIDSYKKEMAEADPTATRTASGEVLARLIPVRPELVGGSADLTGPTCTLTPDSRALNDGEDAANYIYYGIREHGMGAVMNGIALHGPFIPYGGTFFAFADYMKPAIRLSAIMNRHVIYVMTHDSFAIGEDGPTHQPVEQMNAYRGLPNMIVIRPADRQETAEAWQVALDRNGPSILALTRLAVGDSGMSYRKENKVASGGYLVKQSDTTPRLSLIATGSELAPTIAAAAALSQEGISCDVVSMPCLELFLEQPEPYRNEVVRGELVFVVEAASTSGWERIRETTIGFKAMHSFGASGKKDHLIEHFGYTASQIAEAAKAFVEGACHESRF